MSKEKSGMGAEEEIGFHRGALSTLSAERSELIRMLNNVGEIAKVHLNRLKELGFEGVKEGDAVDDKQ